MSNNRSKTPHAERQQVKGGKPIVAIQLFIMSR